MKELIKIFGGLTVIAAVISVIDIAFGEIARHTLLSGQYSKMQYSINASEDADILIVGSSRANHHYDTPFITDSLGIRAYNSGQDGRGLTFMLPLIQSYLSHNHPKIIVLEVLPALDGVWNDRISMLFPLAPDNEFIYDEAVMVDDFNRFYLKSSLLRHNSNIHEEIISRLHPYNPESRGFDAIAPRSGYPVVFDNSMAGLTYKTDTTEYNALRDIIRYCKNKDIEVVGVISPTYTNAPINPAVIQIFNDEKAHLIDNRSFRLDVQPEEYFNDDMHLNSRGAREYTRFFMHQLTDSLQLIAPSSL